MPPESQMVVMSDHALVPIETARPQFLNWLYTDDAEVPFLPETIVKMPPDSCDTDAVEVKEGFDGVRVCAVLSPTEIAKFYSHSASSRLDVLQSWEGAVMQVDRDNGVFTARLHDLTDPAADVSEAEFDISDVSDNDRELLGTGGVFRWLIGHRKHNFGQRERVSAIVFRRLPTWDENDLNAAVTEGKRLAQSIRVK